jgi:hypothetical protein
MYTRIAKDRLRKRLIAKSFRVRIRHLPKVDFFTCSKREVRLILAPLLLRAREWQIPVFHKHLLMEASHVQYLAR